jgi:hypothetical protein
MGHSRMMRVATLLAIGILGLGASWITTRHYARGGWYLAVQKDRFSGQTTCTITTGRVSLVRDTLIFRLGRNALTADAHFRVDGGPVRSVREVLALDEARGFFPDRGWIEDPSESEVAIPVSYAQDARAVWIQANPRSTPRAFRLGGLGYILRAAAGLGCPLRT